MIDSNKMANDKSSKKWIVAIVIFVGFFLLYIRYTKSPFFLGSVFGIFNARMQPTDCFEFNLKTYCPGDPGFIAIFDCNREGISCPEGMVCSLNGMCEIAQPKVSSIPLLIVGIVLLAWIIRME